MEQNKLTKKWMKNHWHYSWWKYVLLICLCVAVTNVIFTMTAYRAPEEKKIEVFVLNGYCDSIALQQALVPPFLAAHPDQEEVTVMNINLTSGDVYATMQFSTYMAARQGDVCMMPRSELLKLAAEGAEHVFMELTPYVESGVIRTKDIDLTGGMLANSAGEVGLYAIPTDSLVGLEAYGNDPVGSYLCIFDYNGNDENAAAMLGLMIEQLGAGAQEGESAQTPAILF